MNTLNFICYLNFLPQIYSPAADFFISNTVEKLKDYNITNLLDYAKTLIERHVSKDKAMQSKVF